MPTGEYTTDNPRITIVGTILLRGFNCFRHPEANYYVCDDVNVHENIMSIIRGDLDEYFDDEFLEVVYSFRAVDNDTITVHANSHSISTTLPTGVSSERYEELTMTLKRVQ